MIASERQELQNSAQCCFAFEYISLCKIGFYISVKTCQVIIHSLLGLILLFLKTLCQTVFNVETDEIVNQSNYRGGTKKNCDAEFRLESPVFFQLIGNQFRQLIVIFSGQPVAGEFQLFTLRTKLFISSATGPSHARHFLFIKARTGPFGINLQLASTVGLMAQVVGYGCTVKLGGTVATVGFPNIGLQGFAPKLAKGEIASLSGAGDDARYFQISVPVQPGNSGGALVDERGNVVGVVSAKLSARAALATSGALPENVNYAVKSSYLLSFLESVPEVSAKLKEPETKERKFEDVVKSAEQAAVLVLVY